MTILLHKPYLVKVTTKGGGGSKMPKNVTTWFMDDPLVLYRYNQFIRNGFRKTYFNIRNSEESATHP